MSSMSAMHLSGKAVMSAETCVVHPQAGELYTFRLSSPALLRTRGVFPDLEHHASSSRVSVQLNAE